MIRAAIAAVVSTIAIAATGWGGEIAVTPFVGGYTFADRQNLTTRPEYGLRAGFFFTDNLAAEAVADYVATRTTDGNRHVGVWKYRGEALYRLRSLSSERLMPHVAAGGGATTLSGPRRETTGIIDYGGGFSYSLSRSLALRGDVRHLFLPRDSRNNVEYTMGVAFIFGGRGQSVAASPFPPPRSTEQDRLTKLTERRQPEAPQTDNGIPGGKPTDGEKPSAAQPEPRGSDGGPDSQVPENRPTGGGQGTLAAAPAPVPPGQQQQTVEVPPEPEKSGSRKPQDNCCTDSDRDGVPDICDRCPDTPPGVKVDRDGCPERKKVCITLNVTFDFDKFTIKPEFEPDIARVASFLGVYPTATAIIEGHTDSTGTTEYNHWLSFRRADSIIRHLIQKYGISADRLAARGYGETRPVTDNGTPQGRQKNRRIEAIIDCGLEPPAPAGSR